MWLVLISTIASICNAQSTFYKSFNVANEFEASNNTFSIKSTLNTNNDEQLNISFSFANGRCWNPKLQLSFEEIDFDKSEEYFLVYYPSQTDMIANCSGSYQQKCGYFTQCINNYDFSSTKFFEDGEMVTIYVTKSAEVNPFCDGYSMNLNVTIQCSYEQYHIWHIMNSNSIQPLYGHIVAYYNHTLTVIGGSINLGYSHNIYTKTITPYINGNASGNSLQFATNTWQTDSTQISTMRLFCDGQCSTQIDNMLYIFGAFDIKDSVHGSLLKFDLNDQLLVDTATYDTVSALSSLSRVCVTNNGSHIFIVGGYDGRYDGISSSPYHNIQLYDIEHDTWIASFSFLIEPRTDAGCAVVHNRLYIIGGYTVYNTQTTNSIEILDMNSMAIQMISVVLDNTRIGHKVLHDNKDRLWIIGGRDVNTINIPDVEIFDTRNNTMISTQVPIKYGSTMSDSDYSAPWYDKNNNIMFTSGGYDGATVTGEIQYLSVDTIGTDAYPTPPPTPHPIPTPYPTPIGHYIGLNKKFDMQSYKPTDTVSFTQIIQSTEDLRTDSSFFYVDFKFINGMCSNASLSFKFEEVDFRTSTTEFIDVFYPVYPVNEIAHCTGLNDFNCDTWITCINRMKLQQPMIDSTDNSFNYLISVVKSAEVNNFCTYAINANVTIHCGPPPPPTPNPTLQPTVNPTTIAPTTQYTNISQTFNMISDMNNTVSFTQVVQSTRDSSRDELYFIEFDFINGKCDNPRLTFSFEEIDFAEATEFLEIYYPSFPANLLQRCDGSADQHCGYFIECVSSHVLTYDSTDKIKLTLLKSAEVGKWCEYSLNANISITCGPMSNMPTPAPTDSDNMNITQIFDVSNYTSNDLVLFTIPVKSQIDNGFDSLFRIEFLFINGQCNNPTLRFDFEEIDFEQRYEFIEVYSPTYPNDFIKQCTGSNDYNCGTNINCIDTLPLYSLHPPITNPTNSITIYLLKSAEINKFCEYSMNANVTISCGPAQPTKPPTNLPSLNPTPNPTSPQFAFDHTFDLSTIDTDKLINDFEINIHSVIDNGLDVIFNVTFEFINGICYNPYLSVKFEEIDHFDDDEYLEIRYPSDEMYDIIARCDGNQDQNCGVYEQCMSYYDLAIHNISTINDKITIYILKSAQVNNFCDNSINANITISCVSSAQHMNISCPPTPICTPSPISYNIVSDVPTNTPIMPTDCGGANQANDSENKKDQLMDYLPWILFGVSGFLNFLLLIALIQQCRFRKSIEMRQRMALRNDSTQMVTMSTRAGHSNFQEIISDASVDYVTMHTR